MTNLLLALLKALVGVLMAMFPPEKVREIIDKAFDAVEDKVIASPTHWDDTLILPMLKGLREALNIPDNDAPINP